jgi:hypothetical protein
MRHLDNVLEPVSRESLTAKWAAMNRLVFAFFLVQLSNALMHIVGE